MRTSYLPFLGVLLAATNLHATPTYSDQIAIMQAQIQLLEKQSELNLAIQKAAGSSSMALPKVLSIIQDSTGSQASIFYASGRVRVIQKGDVIIPGVVATEISSLGVSAKTRNGTTLLAFHNPTQTGDASASDSTQLPPPPKVKLSPLPPPSARPLPHPPTDSADGSEIPMG